MNEPEDEEEELEPEESRRRSLKRSLNWKVMKLFMHVLLCVV